MSTQSPSAFVDASKRGNVWAHLGIGITGIVLAIIMVIGQISVVTTRGISEHLHNNISHLKEGNKNVKEIIGKSMPTVAMEQVVAKQQAILAHTNETMAALNTQMTAIGDTTDSMATTVAGMKSTSVSLSGGVASMNKDTEAVVKLLQPLPEATVRTHTQLKRIGGDSHAINGELSQIAAKMLKYGLPHARGAG